MERYSSATLFPRTAPFLLLGLFGLFPSFSSGYLLSGQVLEKGSKSPIPGASLFIEALESRPATWVQLSPTPSRALVQSGTPSISATPTLTFTPPPESFSAGADIKGNYKIVLPAGRYKVV